MRPILPEEKIHADIKSKIAGNHSDIVLEVREAVAHNKVVVVGMAQNPQPKKACRLLENEKIEYKYLEYGSYLNNWYRRNALKMWTGWPTFPMIFINGFLIGGASDLRELIESDKLSDLLSSKN